MAVNKVVYGGKTLIDLTRDTVTKNTLAKGVTAHQADGSVVIGEFIDDEIDRILTAGLTDGYKHFSDDGTIISTTDSQGRTLKKTFSKDFKSCVSVLTGPNNEMLGRTERTYMDDGCTIITTDSKGQKLTKKFSNDLKTMTAVLIDRNGRELARMTKVVKNNGQDIESTVVYGR